MNFSMTIDYATVSTMAKDEYEMLRHIEACFLAAGYDSDTFAEHLAHYLELYHGMTVLPEEEYQQALDEAREEAYGEGREHREEKDREHREWREGNREHREEEEEWSSAQWYNAGWNDGYSGGDPDEEMKEDRVYMTGYKNGRAAREQAWQRIAGRK